MARPPRPLASPGRRPASTRAKDAGAIESLLKTANAISRHLRTRTLELAAEPARKRTPRKR